MVVVRATVDVPEWIIDAIVESYRAEGRYVSRKKIIEFIAFSGEVGITNAFTALIMTKLWRNAIPVPRSVAEFILRELSSLYNDVCVDEDGKDEYCNVLKTSIDTIEHMLKLAETVIDKKIEELEMEIETTIRGVI